jgi:putative methyltransferase (TIGR04325 family)
MLKPLKMVLCMSTKRLLLCSSREIKKWIPEAIIHTLNKITGRTNSFKGEYKTFEEALISSEGYNSRSLLAKIVDANLGVLNGQAKYEKDGLLFDKIDFSYELNSFLLRVYVEKNKPISILDYGGSLGTTYRQFKEFADSQIISNWLIVEQQGLVEAAKKYISIHNLNFISNEDVNFDKLKTDVVIFSSSLEFLPDPDQALTSILKANPSYIIFDRTPVSESSETKICVLKAQKKIGGSYPCWIFSSQFFFKKLHGFQMISRWDSAEGSFKFSGSHGKYEGMAFKRKDFFYE